MTVFVAAYDVEMFDVSRFSEPVPTCLQALERIVAVHKAYEMPATFFLTGKALESAPEAYRALLDAPLFEVASHGYDHLLLCDHPICGKAASPDQIQEEIFHSKALVEEIFERACYGFRTPCGYDKGLQGAVDVLSLLQQAGYQYVSSQLWGEDYSLPAPVQDSYTYAAEGFNHLREFPAHGWHENLLKGSNRIFGMQAARILRFPPLYPQAVPPGYVRSPQEEFDYNNRFFIERAKTEERSYVSLIWHPWSLGLFDPKMEMLHLTFDYLREIKMSGSTFVLLCQQMAAG